MQFGLRNQDEHLKNFLNANQTMSRHQYALRTKTSILHIDASINSCCYALQNCIEQSMEYIYAKCDLGFTSPQHCGSGTSHVDVHQPIVCDVSWLHWKC